MTEKNNISNRHIILIGMMGVGKSRVGRELSKKLLTPFVDSDQEIEKAANMSIAEIFAAYGEAFFREREAKVIERLLNHASKTVIASGGGAFLNPLTRQTSQEKAISVWLTADLDVTTERALIKQALRPLLANQENPKDMLSALFEKRKDIYAMADLICDTTHKTPEEAAEDIMQKIRDFNDKK